MGQPARGQNDGATRQRSVFLIRILALPSLYMQCTLSLKSPCFKKRKKPRETCSLRGAPKAACEHLNTSQNCLNLKSKFVYGFAFHSAPNLRHSEFLECSFFDVNIIGSLLVSMHFLLCYANVLPCQCARGPERDN